eukprot:TRINITY_DN50008_c0_g1_i1.p1 TRINITY_DN50008_c0_g1~~TRINITY_DN50008_c0_g1_i1.p1  ORF type:complete len:412 (-),score=51.13 TRINITY_DN50008_c0_g1_i1:85-1320(-)
MLLNILSRRNVYSPICRVTPRLSSSFCRYIKHEGSQMVQVPADRLDELIRAEVAYYASVPVQALSIRKVLDTPPDMLAQFCAIEGPKRLALRIRLLEGLEGWKAIPELVEMHGLLNRWYRSLLVVPKEPMNLQELVSSVKLIRKEGQQVVKLAAVGCRKLQGNSATGEFSDKFLDNWLDGFLLSRIGTNVLADQLVARVSIAEGGKGSPTGIIDPRCDAIKIAKAAAIYSARLCEEYAGHKPAFIIESFRAGQGRLPERSPCQFSYIPSYLRYILCELLKNAFRATVVNASGEEDIQQRPVKIRVCFDQAKIAIMVSDRAGGIPFDVGDRIWSYQYGAAAKGAGSYKEATPLAGYGIGLPFSRLYARYLGGDLQITSYPGYGTQAHVVLPRIDVDQVEALPDDNSTLGNLS